MSSCSCLGGDESASPDPTQQGDGPAQEKTPTVGTGSYAQRYKGDFVDWSNPWPTCKRMESTESGAIFWAKVREAVGIEFFRKDYLERMSRVPRPMKRVTWSLSVELAYTLDHVMQNMKPHEYEHFQGRWGKNTEEIEYYKVDKKDWEQGQRLIAEELEISDDD